MEYDLLINEVAPVVKEAGQAILGLYHTEYKVEEKHDKSPVTEADLLSDKIIEEGLEKYAYPILSEESEDDLRRLESDRVWIVDSLDGTKDFLQKTDEFAVMVGLAEKGIPVLGFVYLPTEDKLYYASKGQGAYLVVGEGEPVKLKVSEQGDVKEAVLVVSRNHMRPEIKEAADKLRVGKFLQVGSNGVKMGLVAEGKADLYFNPTDRMGQWDVCAPHIIVEEAGGKVSGVHGETLAYNDENVKNPYGIVATNAILHNHVISVFLS